MLFTHHRNKQRKSAIEARNPSKLFVLNLLPAGVELCRAATWPSCARFEKGLLPILLLLLSLSLNTRGRDDKRLQVTRKSVTCFPLEKKGEKKKGRKKEARNINSMRGSWLKSGVATRMLSAPILICSLPARGYGQRSLKSILTWARVVHTRKCVYPRASSLLYAP